MTVTITDEGCGGTVQRSVSRRVGMQGRKFVVLPSNLLPWCPQGVLGLAWSTRVTSTPASPLASTTALSGVWRISREHATLNSYISLLLFMMIRNMQQQRDTRRCTTQDQTRGSNLDGVRHTGCGRRTRSVYVHFDKYL